MLQKVQVTSPLSRKAVLVSVVINQWTARKLDRRITEEVNTAHGAAKDAGRYNKLLIEASRLENIGSIVSQARIMHYKYTKPWADEGLRILPNALHSKFAEEFRRIKREFHAAADEFCRDYPTFVDERARALNGLFNAADYPDPAAIRSKFKLDTRTFPVPEAGDFRSDVLDDDTIADIRAELETTAAQVLDDAKKHTGEQIIKVVGHMAEKLKEYKSKKGGKSFFTDSLVQNVRDLAELLPAFNLSDDPKIAQITDRIQRELCVEDADTLRNDDKTRKAVQKSADRILHDVSSLLG